MSHHQRSTSQAGGGGESGKTYFDEQREALIGEIAMSFEHVLANINKLNRSLEAVTAVGTEFSSVEALWSQFENVMGKPHGEEGGAEEGKNERGASEGQQEEETTEQRTRSQSRGEGQ